jgi:hypothetical protein
MVNYHPLLVVMQVDYITTTLEKVNYFIPLICSYGLDHDGLPFLLPLEKNLIDGIPFSLLLSSKSQK